MKNTQGDKEYRGVSLREPMNKLRDQIPALLDALDAIIGASDQVTNVKRNASMKDLRSVLGAIQIQMAEVPNIPPIENTAKLFEKLRASALPTDTDLIDRAKKLLFDLTQLIEPASFYRFMHKNNTNENIGYNLPEDANDDTDHETDYSSVTDSDETIEDILDASIKMPSEDKKTSAVYNQNLFFKKAVPITNTPNNENKDFLSIQSNLKELKKVAREFFQKFKSEPRQYGQGNLGHDANAIYNPFHHKFRILNGEMNQIKTKWQVASGQKKSDLGDKLKGMESKLMKLNEDIKNKIAEINLQKQEKNPSIRPTFRR